MKQITIEVPEKKFNFMMELLQNFTDIKVHEKKIHAEHKSILRSVAKGLKEIKMVEEGKIKSKSAKKFLSEI